MLNKFTSYCIACYKVAGNLISYRPGVANLRLASRMRLFSQFNAAPFHMVCFFYQHYSSAIMMRLITHEVHYHMIIILLREFRQGMSRVAGPNFAVLRLGNTASKSEETSQHWRHCVRFDRPRQRVPDRPHQ